MCTAGSDDRPDQPSVVFRYHLYPDAQGRFLSVGDQGRARAQGAVLASGIEHMRRPLKQECIYVHPVETGSDFADEDGKNGLAIIMGIVPIWCRRTSASEVSPRSMKWKTIDTLR